MNHIATKKPRTLDKRPISHKPEKYINLKLNGRLFPTWVVANFKRFKLPEIFIDGSDPCNDQKTNSELKKYQDFLGKYLDYNSPYRDILIYHGLGSGKTRSAINIYNVLYNYSPDWNVFILLKATLIESTWQGELNRWLQQEEKEFRKQNIAFIPYDAPNADKIFFDKVKNADVTKKSMYIIEEAHNFISNVYTNLSTKQGRRAISIYEHIIQDKQDSEGTRVILISGSPAINVPFELALMFNLLRHDAFPKSEGLFNQTYVSTTSYPTINPATKNNFQRRIMGLVSYYIGATPDFYAKKVMNYVDVPMSEYQAHIYLHYEQIEEKIAKKSSKKSGNYKSYTRQSCNFVFPPISQGISGETRPRPKDFKIKESMVEQYTKGQKEDEKEKYYRVDEYLEKANEFVSQFDAYLQRKLADDIKNSHTMVDDVQGFMDRTKGKFDIDDYVRFIDSDTKKSSLLETLHGSSAKMTFMIFNILISAGPVLVYSNYVVMEGLQVFKIYLKYFGYTGYVGTDHGTDGKRYMEYHGGIDFDERRKVLEIFNRPNNVRGEVSKIIMISPAGAEGLSLNNVRQVHLMEPYWHEVRMTQMIGRAIRNCSHRGLPVDERVVMVYRYKSVRAKRSDKWTTDQYIEDMARTKDALIAGFLDAVKEVAVDCMLYKAHNSLVSNYRCFQFEEKSLFEQQIGPAFKEDLHDDTRMDNGLNAPNTSVRRIKIIKIKAVRQLVGDKDNEAEPRPDSELYSKPEECWYSPESHTVYDLDLQYPFGKVGVDDEGIPMKLTNEVFIITHVIPIPRIVD
jgi:hypothetical protein